MLFNQVMKGFSDTIVEDLDLILDELTPIYKARYEELSEKQQIIINAIAMHWDPLSLDKIREITGLDAGQLSPQLKRLSETGWIEKPLYEKRKGGAYELSERMFNIWYLMRRSSRRQKKGVFCLSKYLEAFYENEDELQGWIVRYISVPLTTKHHAITALALAKLSSDKDLRWRLHEQSLEYIKTNPDFIQNIDATDLYESIEESTQAFVDASKQNDTQQILITTESLLSNPVLSQLNIYEDVVINRTLALIENGQLNEAIDLMNNNAQIKTLAPIWVQLATIVHNNKGSYEEVKKYLEQAIVVDNACGEAYIFLGKLYTELGDESNANMAFDKASTLYTTEPLELILAKGILSVLSKRGEDPETTLKMVLSRESDNKEALFYLGCHLFYSKKDNYGLEYFKELKELDPQNITVDVWLFVIYQILNNPDLANQLLDDHQKEITRFYRGVASIYSIGDMPEDAYKYWVKAVEEDERDIDSMTSIVIYCLSEGYYDEAVLYVEKILAISPDNADGLYLGGIAYLMQGNLDKAKVLILSSLRKEPTERMYSLLGRLNEQEANYEDAKECYHKALELNGNRNKNIFVLEKLGELYRDIFKDYASSENSFLQIKDENPFLLISLYRDYMNRTDEAKKIFEGFELTNNNTEYELEKILFLIHDRMMDEASKLFSVLMERMKEESGFPKYSDAFIRFYSICIRGGRGQWLLDELDLLNLREELAPDYHAIAAIVSNNPEAYLDTVALEIREISMTIVSRMMRRL
jgi:tetratricopeptide (TPR) repeat protein